MLSLRESRFLEIYMNRKLRYALLVTLMGSPSFSMPEKEELEKKEESKDSTLPVIGASSSSFPVMMNPILMLEEDDRKACNLAIRAICYTSYNYNYQNSAFFGPQTLKGTDIERDLRNDSDVNFYNRIKQIEGIMRSHGILVPTCQEGYTNWKWIRSALSLENAVYPADSKASNKEINPVTKRETSIHILLATKPELLDKNRVRVFYNTDTFELAEKINKQIIEFTIIKKIFEASNLLDEKVVNSISSEKDVNSKEKSCYPSSEVEHSYGSKKIEENPDSKE